MTTARHTHILGAASNLLGISLAIITALNVSHMAATSLADQVAWVAAVSFAASTLLSYAAMRGGRLEAWLDGWADRIFLIGLLALLVSVSVLAFENA